jgi:hypothetical protein
MRHVLLLAAAALTAGAAVAVFGSCIAGRIIISAAGGEQKFLADTVVFTVNRASQTSVEFVKLYENDKQTLPETVQVSVDRRSNLYVISYDEHPVSEYLHLSGSYHIKEEDESMYHAISLTAEHPDRDPLRIELTMRIFYQPLAKARYQFSRCRINGSAFSTKGLVAAQAGYIRPRWDSDGTSMPLLPRQGESP